MTVNIFFFFFYLSSTFTLNNRKSEREKETDCEGVNSCLYVRVSYMRLSYRTKEGNKEEKVVQIHMERTPPSVDRFRWILLFLGFYYYYCCPSLHPSLSVALSPKINLRKCLRLWESGMLKFISEPLKIEWNRYMWNVGRPNILKLSPD